MRFHDWKRRSRSQYHDSALSVYQEIDYRKAKYMFTCEFCGLVFYCSNEKIPRDWEGCAMATCDEHFVSRIMNS